MLQWLEETTLSVLIACFTEWNFREIIFCDVLRGEISKKAAVDLGHFCCWKGKDMILRCSGISKSDKEGTATCNQSSLHGPLDSLYDIYTVIGYEA